MSIQRKLIAALMLTLSTFGAQADVIYQAEDTNSHAVWLPENYLFTPGTHYKWVEESLPKLTFTGGDSWETATAATLTGQIYQTDGFTSEWIPSVFDVHIDFIGGYTEDEWLDLGGAIHTDGKPIDEAHMDDWKYFTFDPDGTSTFTLVSGLSLDHEIEITSKMLSAGLQVGLGGSLKETNGGYDTLGAAAWIKTHSDIPFTHHEKHGYGDININLSTAEPPTTLIPVPAAFGTGVVLLGMFALRRKRNTASRS